MNSRLLIQVVWSLSNQPPPPPLTSFFFYFHPSPWWRWLVKVLNQFPSLFPSLFPPSPLPLTQPVSFSLTLSSQHTPFSLPFSLSIPLPLPLFLYPSPSLYICASISPFHPFLFQMMKLNEIKFIITILFNLLTLFCYILCGYINVTDENCPSANP